METAIGHEEVQGDIGCDKITGEIDRHCRWISDFYSVESLVADIAKQMRGALRPDREAQSLR